MKTFSKITLKLIAFSCISVSMAQSEITSEELLILNDSIKLPGTLTYTKTLKKQPLAIFIHGSGNVDRNGNQAGLAGANFIKQLSEALNKNDIAFFRYDKRTSNRDNMKYLMKGISFNDFVKDAKLVIEKLKTDNRFSTITIIGHSQGSLIGMLNAKNADKYISLAGPADAIDKTITEQIRTQNGDSLGNIVDSHFKELKSTGKIEKVDPNLFSMFNPINQKFFGTWIAYNPAEEMAKVNIPTLVINGTKDLQVKVPEAELLHKANSNSELKIIENLNHVLKTITKDEDNLKSYSSADYLLSEALVTAITEFIKK